MLRGDEHCSNPELMALTLADPDTDFIFGLTGNRTLTPLAEPFLEHNRKAHAVRERAPRRWRQAQNPPPIGPHGHSDRVYETFGFPCAPSTPNHAPEHSITDVQGVQSLRRQAHS